MGEFGRFGLEKFTPGRGVVIEVAHFDDRAFEQGGRLWRRAGCAGESPGVCRAGLTAGQDEAGDRGDRSERLAAKTERADLFEVGE